MRQRKRSAGCAVLGRLPCAVVGRLRRRRGWSRPRGGAAYRHSPAPLWGACNESSCAGPHTS
ncbi:hypothetical protein FGK60_40530 [Streptomyces sp. DASNCL29]|nr:hypothetical protein FGK60_40530 [Streptomyces sp. DASNCL29]